MNHLLYAQRNAYAERSGSADCTNRVPRDGYHDACGIERISSALEWRLRAVGGAAGRAVCLAAASPWSAETKRIGFSKLSARRTAKPRFVRSLFVVVPLCERHQAAHPLLDRGDDGDCHENERSARCHPPQR